MEDYLVATPAGGTYIVSFNAHCAARPDPPQSTYIVSFNAYCAARADPPQSIPESLGMWRYPPNVISNVCRMMEREVRVWEQGDVMGRAKGRAGGRVRAGGGVGTGGVGRVGI